MIRFDRDICGNLEAATSREWLETNGLGGFASSTIVGLNTRRYHGLLVAATQPPVGRMLLLSKLEETLILGDQRFELSANQYPGVVHPQGHRYLKQFRLDPFPVFVYEVEGVELEKSVFMVQGENTTVVQYALRARKGTATQCRLEVRPLIAFRDYHSTTHANDSLNRHVESAAPGLATVMPYEGVPALHFAHDAAELEPGDDWYRNFEYAVERERGLDFQEDLYSPFVLRFDLAGRPQATIIASTEVRSADQAAEYREQEVARRRAVVAIAPADDFVRALVTAADQYIVARGDEKTVIAGYPWFADWGRDTMIALHGLCLATGRHDMARQILLAFARVVDRGMLPNRFPDAGEAPEYNTVDATLWFFEAARAYRAATGDDAFVRENLYSVSGDIIDWHIRGTRYGIRADHDGLLASGEPGVQLTWMDAKVGDWVITPRHGKAVEIQALWYNALCVMEEFARDFGDVPGRKRYTTLAENAKASFNATFWNDAAGCLYDVVSHDSHDASLRPNQILAVSLPYGMLPPERARSVVEVVERELLTPYGLRSLAPGDPQYRPRYEGDPRSRDSAYHQGTVWPWLIGPFLTAYCRVHRHSKQSQTQARKWLEPLHAHLSEAGLGQISEIFDADAPHRPRGCFAQAWSVAEVLRALVEDVIRIKTAPATKGKTAPRRTKRPSVSDAVVSPK